ncbi:MAG: hypothetical protein ACI8QD_000139 [Cyclobacteriaceae bacterium]|jgi:hypothetical protein
MKRHAKLISLSRQHHQQLLLARLMRLDAPLYKGLPTIVEEKVSYAIQFFHEHLIDHFSSEERLFDSLKSYTLQTETLALIKKQKEYQDQLKASFLSLTVASLDQTGRLMEDAVRHEERILFQHLQQNYSLEDGSY